MTYGPKQLRVLRLLHAHRYADAAQIAALAFDDASPRACQACLRRLHAKGLVHRFALQRGGLAGGRASYIYSLSAAGARTLAAATEIPLAKIVHESRSDAAAARAYRAEHQLLANRCLIALRDATRAHPGAELGRWTSDPHLRMRFRWGRGWRVLHPDALARIRIAASEGWCFFEFDRGTQLIAAYVRKVAQYARFYLSTAWKGHFAPFPAVRIVTTKESRIGDLRLAAQQGIGMLPAAHHRELAGRLAVRVAWTHALLRDPLGAVWLPAFGDGVTHLAVVGHGPVVPAVGPR